MGTLPATLARGRGILLRNLRLFKELESLLDVLPGFEPVLLKGAGLLALGRADMRERLMEDVDLLLRPEELARAARGLLELGFTALPGQPAQFRKEDLDFDLQTGVWYLDEAELELFRGRARRVAVGERWARVPAPEDHFIYVVAHAAVHHGELEPKWAADARALLESGEVDRDRAWRRLSELGLGPAAGWFLTRSGLPIGEPRDFFSLMTARLLDRLDMPNRGPVLQLLFLRDWRFRLRNLRKMLFPDRAFLMGRYELKTPGEARYWRLLRPFILFRNLCAALAAWPGKDRGRG